MLSRMFEEIGQLLFSYREIGKNSVEKSNYLLAAMCLG